MSSLGEPRQARIRLGPEVTNALRLEGSKRTPERVVFVFHAPRVAKLQGGRVPGWRWEPASRVLGRAAPNAIALVREDPEAQLPERVVVASHGDPLQLARVALEVEKRYVHVRRAPASEAPTVLARVEDAPQVFDHAEYQRAMRRTLDLLPVSPYRRAREFFFELDRHSEPDLVATNPFRTPSVAEGRRMLNAVAFVRRALSVRQAARIREHRATPFRSTPFADAASFRPMVQRVSDLFLRLAFAHFPDAGGGIDLAAFEEAFELFATGELRLWLEDLGVWTTEPSSGAFFLFGEFALLAVECGVETEHWSRLANVMVRAQLLFGRTYAPDAEPPRLADFAAANHDPDLRPAPSERAALRAAYAGLSHTELSIAAQRNLAALAPGEFDDSAREVPPAAPPPPTPPPAASGTEPHPPPPSRERQGEPVGGSRAARSGSNDVP